MKPSKFSLGALAMSLVGLANADDIVVSQNISSDTTWVADDVYILNQPIFVTDNATLTIEPGTMIVGTSNQGGFGSLVVTRGSKLNAEGTAARPIVFTAAVEAEARLGRDLNGDQVVNMTPLDPFDPLPPNQDSGYWGGVILLGNAPINFFNGSLAQESTVVEGFPSQADNITYGGTNPADSSGILRYVSIQFGGFEFAADAEINGLTLGGVGNGTVIENVEVVANSDDGIEFFGGTVNTRNMVMAYNLDESFDVDQGHQGCHQFWFSLQSPNSDNGSELDGGDGSNSAIKTNSPLTVLNVHNATYIGGGAQGDNDGFRMKDNFTGQFYNSVFHDFGGSLFRIDDASTGGQVASGRLVFNNNTFGTFLGGLANTSADGQRAAELALAAQPGNSPVNTDPQLTSLTRNSDGEVTVIDPRPAAGSPLLSGSLSSVPSDACYSKVDYRGAFAPDSNWAEGWTYLSKNGFFGTSPVTSRTVTSVTANITADTIWTNDTNYVLDQPIFVTNDATLTIEEGTHVFANNNMGGFGSLVITQGAKIEAIGSATNPIVMTAGLEGEARFGIDLNGDGIVNTIPLNPNDPADPNAGGSGYWGGLILLGKAPINFFNGSLRQETTVIEGFPAQADDITYGGTEAADSSGTLRYVSIQFGGFEFAPDAEINGLTLGGVGSGTDISFVEIVGNTDDGIEFFGGTVDTKNMIVAFCEDEGFDVDQGHQGTHQFWFNLQTDGGDNGSELDGGDGSNSAVKTNEPLTSLQVYNATYVGGGPDSPSSKNAFRMKDNYSGQFHNSIFHDFGGALFRIDDAATSARTMAAMNPLAFQNNIFGTFAQGVGAADPGMGESATEIALAMGAGNSAVGTDPLLRSISPLRTGSIDPRPRLDSPALASNGATLSPVPAGLQTVDYRGAFGSTNWADGWTYLSKTGILVSAPGSGQGSAAFRQFAGTNLPDTPFRAPGDDADGDGLSNFEEFAFGGNLTQPDASLIQGQIVNGAFTASFRQRESGVTYQVFISDTLPFSQTPADASEFTLTTGAATDGFQPVTVTLTGTPTGQRFVRIVATES